MTVDPKIMKAAKKEGTKAGHDIAGMSAMGGMQFFVKALSSAEGDMEALQAAVAEMNNETSDLGIMSISDGTGKLSIHCRIPANKTESVSAKDWVAASIKSLGFEVPEDSTAELVETTLIPKEGQFPIKMKDEIIGQAFEFLKQKGLFLDDDESDDDFVFGDDDLGSF
mmetsp:Transcript_9825/g.8351  ORF Transcript_9825/g.8351 Transcript_9825/m.8351 type:complete len:168 (+) Transcript_9825:66-569(+)